MSDLKMQNLRLCNDCGAEVPEGTPECQSLFDEVIAREFSDYRYGRIHRLTVDVYSLQHPDKYMRSGKSFTAHLTGVCAALEHENNVEMTLKINRLVQKWLSGNPTVDRPATLPRQAG